MCQLTHLSLIHQNRPKTSHVGDKVTKVVHLEEVAVVFSPDKICRLVNPWKACIDPPADGVGQQRYAGLLEQSDSSLISLTPGPDDLPPRV